MWREIVPTFFIFLARSSASSWAISSHIPPFVLNCGTAADTRSGCKACVLSITR